MQIGSEYALKIEDVPFQNNEIPFPYLKGFLQAFFSSGRGALRSLLRHIDGKRALLPENICQSVIHAFELEGYEVSFYCISSRNTIDIVSLKPMLMETDVFLLMQYFGFLQNPSIGKEIQIACEKNSVVIIEDTTHSIFSSPITVGHYAIASLRKWFGLPDGAVVYSSDRAVSDLNSSIGSTFTQMRLVGMLQKDLFLTGVSEDSKLHRFLLENAENYLDENSAIEGISEVSSSILSQLDVKAMVRKRRDNYRLLYSLLKDQQITIATPPLAASICPLFLVVESNQRDALRHFLSEKSILCPVHWPIEDSRLLGRKDLLNQVERVLSIPIDQRYGSEEMMHIARMIKEFGRQ